ncbi:MAG: nucleotidyltransferase domain-containing protein [Thermoprotei archaeon]
MHVEKLKKILDKPSIRDLVEDLAKIIEEIIEKRNPLSVIIAGSLAEGKFVRGLSDIDILVIVDKPVDDKERFSLRAVKDVDVEITVYSYNELIESLKRGNQFIGRAISRGIEVYGNLLNKIRDKKI